MPFCTACGAEHTNDVAYCAHCGATIQSRQQVTVLSTSPLLFSGWILRFVAWLIDVIVVTLALMPIKEVLGPLTLSVPGLSWIPFVNIGVDNIVYFLYWTVMEGTYRQSVGKMALGMKVTQMDGRPITLGAAATESLGKAFLLPLDCFLGWVLYPTNQQRLFNYFSRTTVVKK